MRVLFWKDGRCRLCPHNCIIPDGKKGICHVRKNIDGRLVSLVYGKPISMSIDPIEKKPLYHFLPGSSSLSIGTVGCNMACSHCQNSEISCAHPEDVDPMDVPPVDVVRIAKKKGCESISYTYNEPTIFFEYAMDCARLAKKAGIKNVLVTNGFINPKPAREFCRQMDAANVDLKGFSDKFYRDIAKAKLAPVLETLKIYKKKIWVEVTNLIIDGKNDDFRKIEEMCNWLSGNLGRDTPLHFSRAYPMHMMQEIIPTPMKTLARAKAIASRYLDYVYLGNTDADSNTYCPKCNGLLISRKHYNTISETDGVCSCGEKIPGIF